MYFSTSNLCVSVLLCYSFGLGQFGAPAWGMAGIGWGMALSYWIHSIALLIFLFSKKNNQIYRLPFAWPKLQWHTIKKLWDIGWPIGLKYNAEFFLFFVLVTIIGAMDHQLLAVFQVILQAFMLSSCLSHSVAMCTEALVGQAIGKHISLGQQKQNTAHTAPNKNLITTTCYAGLSLATFYIALLAGFCLLFPTQIAGFFFLPNTDPYFLLIHTAYLVIMFQFLDGARKVTAEILITFKDTRFPLLAEIVGLWGIGLPLGYLLGQYFQLQLVGFLIALVIGLMASMIAMVIRFRQHALVMR